MPEAALGPPAWRASRASTVASCAAALAVAIAAGVEFGSGSAGLSDLFAPGTPAHAIVLGVRLPRVLLGAVAGSGLAAAGASFQTLLRNPLAEPYVLGVSGGAALGATLAIGLGVGVSPLVGAIGVPAVAFVGGLVATTLVWALVRSGRADGASILLAGYVLNSICGAFILLIQALVDPGKLQSLVWWLIGYLDVPNGYELAFVAAYVAGGVAVLLVDAARINLLSIGEESAASLGVDVRALQRRSLLACSAVVGAVVSVTGPIGFVGLVVPQAMRRLLGPDLRVLLPVSILTGGTMLVACDTLVRLLAPVLHTELPVGAVTALVGGPVFLALLARRG